MTTFSDWKEDLTKHIRTPLWLTLAPSLSLSQILWLLVVAVTTLQWCVPISCPLNWRKWCLNFWQATSTTTGHVPDDAVAIQVQQRVEHMIKSLLPRLHGLSLLAAESPLSRTSNITEFQALLGALTINLQNALLSVPSSISRPDPIQPSNPNLLTPATTRHAAMHPNSTRDGNSMKRPHPLTLLPPSPEIRQKRKTSHSIM